MRKLVAILAVMFWLAAVTCAQTGITCRSLDISKANEWNLQPNETLMKNRNNQYQACHTIDAKSQPAPALTGKVTSPSPPAAKKLKLSVRIEARQSSSTQYTYTVPGYAVTNCNLYDYGNSTSANCFASSTSTQSASYTLSGATLSLLLPDNRVVVISCDYKLNWTDWHQKTWRSCREPITDDVEAEFDGDNAKLEWSVSLDSKKKKSETYKIIAVLGKIPEK